MKYLRVNRRELKEVGDQVRDGWKMWRRICGKWRQKAVDRDEWASVIKDVNALRGRQRQGVNKKGIALNFIF
jgi:hypothetical protein